MAALPAAASTEVPLGTFESARLPVFARAGAAIAAELRPPVIASERPPTAVSSDATAALDTGATPRRGGSLSPSASRYQLPPALGQIGPTRTDTFLTERTDLPSYFFKDRVVAPHHSPDFEVGINERSSLGFYGEMTHTNREDVRNNTVRETRDLGAGISFQYKFNSR